MGHDSYKIYKIKPWKLAFVESNNCRQFVYVFCLTKPWQTIDVYIVKLIEVYTFVDRYNVEELECKTTTITDYN